MIGSAQQSKASIAPCEGFLLDKLLLDFIVGTFILEIFIISQLTCFDLDRLASDGPQVFNAVLEHWVVMWYLTCV